MTFHKLVKILGIKYLLKKFSSNFYSIRKFLVIELGKKSGDDISGYLREIRNVMAMDFDINSSIYKPYIIEVIKKVQ